MTAAPDPDLENWHACAVCGFRLERWKGEWLHARDLVLPAEHVVIPVPESQIKLNHRCDVCNGEPVTHEVMAEDFNLPDGDSRSIGAWDLCALCAPLVQRRRLTALVARAIRSFETLHGIKTDRGHRNHVTRVYQLLFIHITSDVRPWSSHDG